MKSEDLLKRNFEAGEPSEKCVTDITEIDAVLLASVIDPALTTGSQFQWQYPN